MEMKVAAMAGVIERRTVDEEPVDWCAFKKL